MAQQGAHFAAVGWPTRAQEQTTAYLRLGHVASGVAVPETEWIALDSVPSGAAPAVIMPADGAAVVFLPKPADYGWDAIRVTASGLASPRFTVSTSPSTALSCVPWEEGWMIVQHVSAGHEVHLVALDAQFHPLTAWSWHDVYFASETTAIRRGKAIQLIGGAALASWQPLAVDNVSWIADRQHLRIRIVGPAGLGGFLRAGDAPHALTELPGWLELGPNCFSGSTSAQRPGELELVWPATTPEQYFSFGSPWLKIVEP